MADGSVTIKASVESKEAEEDLERVKRKAEGVADAAEDAGERGELGFGDLALGAAALAATMEAAAKVAGELIKAAAAAVQYATEFEAAFAKTQTIMDTNVVAAGDMKESVLDLSEATGMAATDVSEAVYQAISGSVDTAAAVGFVDKANQLAVAGFTSLTNATDVLTTTLNAYGMEQSKVGGISNVLIKTQNLGKTSVDELSSSMGKAISTGSAYGVNLQNIATGYVELTKSGIATAEATTYLSGMFNELGKENSEVAKILRDKTGQSFGELMASGKTLGDVLQVLSDAVDGNSEAFMGLWSSQEAGKAANALMVQGVKDFNAVAAQMDAELEDVTGTTEAAYATMTDTSEYIDRRLANSVKNLGIAYGETLQPALDLVKKGLTELFEGFASFINQHPAVVAVLSGVAAALMAVAAGYVALQVAKKAKEAVIALNLAMNANPYMLVAGAIAALVAGLGTFAAVMISDASEAMEKATEKAQALTETLTDGKAALEEELASAAATRDVVNDYADRLEELRAAGLKTNEQQEEYHAILVLLTQTIPELTELIDLETDQIKGGVGTLREYTDAWYENAEAQLYQKYVNELYAKYSETMIEVRKNEIRLRDAQNEKAAREIELNRLQAERNELLDDANRQAEEAFRLTGQWTEATYYNTQELAELDSQIIECSNSITQAEEDITRYTEATERDNKALAAADEELALTKEAVKDLTEEAQRGTETLKTAGETVKEAVNRLKDWSEAAAGLEAAWLKAKDGAEKSLAKQISLVKEAAKTTKTSVKDMISNLQSHAQYMQEYAANLKLAGQKGIDEGLLKHLSDGSEESAGILASMVNMTEEEVADMNAAWQAVEEGKNTLADELAGYSDEVRAKADEMVGIAESAGLDISAELTAGLVNGYSAFAAQLTKYENRLRELNYLAKGASPAAARAAGYAYDERGYPTSHYAGGTLNAAAGYAIVGENGPELVYLRGGERILSAEQTRATMRQIYPDLPVGTWTSAAAPAAVGGYRQPQETTIIVPVQIDGREIARTTATYMGEEMAFEVM